MQKINEDLIGKIIIAVIVISIIVLGYLYINNQNNTSEGFTTDTEIPPYVNGTSMFRAKENQNKHKMIWSNYIQSSSTGSDKYAIMEPKLKDKEYLIGQTYHTNFNEDSIDIKSIVVDKGEGAFAEPNGFSLLFKYGRMLDGLVVVNLPEYTDPDNKTVGKLSINKNFSNLLNKNSVSDLEITLDNLKKYKSKAENDLKLMVSRRSSLYGITMTETYYENANARIILYTNPANFINLNRKDKIDDYRIVDGSKMGMPQNVSGMVIPYGVKVEITLDHSKGERHTLYIPMSENGKNINDVRKKYYNITSYKGFNGEDRLVNGVSSWYLNDLSKGGELGDWTGRIKFINISIPEETTEYASMQTLSKYDSQNKKSMNILKSAIKEITPIISRLDAIKGSIETNPPSFIKCYRMKAPKYHVAIGDIFTTSDNALLEYEAKYVCLPDHCYRKVRDWDANDIIYYGDGFNIYFNPYTRTLHGDNSGYVGKIIACPKQSFMTDILIDNDKAIRETCSQYKTVVEATPIIPDDALAQEMTNMEKQIFDQAVKINTLKKYASGLADKTMETTIINRENNRIKLQEYLNNQQAKVVKGVKKLSNVKDISINLKYPVKMVKMLMDIIAKSDTIPHKTKIDTVKKLKTLVDNDTTFKDKVSDIMEECPIYDMSNYIRKDQVPCYGCVVSQIDE